jgi:hypothetical protein
MCCLSPSSFLGTLVRHEWRDEPPQNPRFQKLALKVSLSITQQSPRRLEGPPVHFSRAVMETRTAPGSSATIVGIQRSALLLSIISASSLLLRSQHHGNGDLYCRTTLERFQRVRRSQHALHDGSFSLYLDIDETLSILQLRLAHACRTQEDSEEMPLPKHRKDNHAAGFRVVDGTPSQAGIMGSKAFILPCPGREVQIKVELLEPLKGPALTW